MPLAGRRWTKVTERRTKIDWAQFIKHITERYIDNLKELREEVPTWQAYRDQLEATVNRQFRAKYARIKLERLYQTFNV